MPKTKYYNLMKKLLNWVVLSVLMLVLAVPMVSCDDDDDPQYPQVTSESLQGNWKRGEDDKSYIFYTVVNPEDKALMTGGRWVEVAQEGLVTVTELAFEGDKVTAKISENVSNVGDFSVDKGMITLKAGDIDQAFKIQFRGMDTNNIGLSYECLGNILQRVYAEDGKTQISQVVAENVKVKVTVHYDRVK